LKSWLIHLAHRTIPLSLYDAYQLFVSRFFDKSPCPSSAVRDLLSPGFPDFIAQTSGTSGSTFKLFPVYPVTEDVDPIFEGVRFCAFSTFRFCGPAVKIVDEHGELQKELYLTNIGSGIMRRFMGIALKDDDKAITETRKVFFPLIYRHWIMITEEVPSPQPPSLPSLSRFGTSQISCISKTWVS
jgi:hypothetical protein